MSSEDRYFNNPFEDYSDVNSIFELNSCQINNKTKDFFSENTKNLLNYLEKNINKSIDPKNYTIYTGSTGFALLYLHLSKVFKDNRLLDKCVTLIESIDRLKGTVLSFLRGDSGIFAISAVVHHLRGHQNKSIEALNSLKSMIVTITDINSYLEDEILNGRSGFLYSLLFVRKLIPNSNEVIDNNDIRAVVDSILRSGQRTSKNGKMSDRCPLMYYWNQKAYIGSAHGIIGILTLLLEANNYLSDEELNKLVRPTIDFILSLRFSSGNFPSSLSNNRDRLVHWCHGCAGAVHLFCLAFQTFKDYTYLMAAKDCCECIWKRGLLKKGYGLCHGTAGNGYAFLRLYQLTDERKHLYRAVKFGEWCCHYGEHGCRVPDRPFSLFEGLSGTIYYLTDLLDPKNSRFPGFQLS